MTMYELKNDVLSISVASMGAELKSLKMNGKEYMWSANPEIWGRTAPVLFPFVGRLKGQQYTYKGKTYTQPAHGFARDAEFELLERTENSMCFGIKDSEETRSIYPFFFEFKIIYTLSDNQLKIAYDVTNNGEEDMLFSVGAHPGFVCPINDNTNRSQCFVRFEKDGVGLDKIVSRCLDMNTGLVTNEYSDYVLQGGNLPIADDLFNNDALVLENDQVNKVSLLDENGVAYVTVEMDAPVYGVWSSVKAVAPYVCIEPWFGRCDAIDFDGDLSEREYQNKLGAKEVFKAEYTVTIA